MCGGLVACLYLRLLGPRLVAILRPLPRVAVVSDAPVDVRHSPLHSLATRTRPLYVLLKSGSGGGVLCSLLCCCATVSFLLCPLLKESLCRPFHCSLSLLQPLFARLPPLSLPGVACAKLRAQLVDHRSAPIRGRPTERRRDKEVRISATLKGRVRTEFSQQTRQPQPTEPSREEEKQQTAHAVRGGKGTRERSVSERPVCCCVIE